MLYWWQTVTIRTDNATGLFGAYEASQDEFWKFVVQGKSPRLVIETRLEGNS